MLLTIEERFAQMERRLRDAQKRADDAMGYAERSARLHHEAICRLNHALTGRHCWPADADQ